MKERKKEKYKAIIEINKQASKEKKGGNEKRESISGQPKEKKKKQT